jgi:hypothetical protein
MTQSKGRKAVIRGQCLAYPDEEYAVKAIRSREKQTVMRLTHQSESVDVDVGQRHGEQEKHEKTENKKEEAENREKTVAKDLIKALLSSR